MTEECEGERSGEPSVESFRPGPLLGTHVIGYLRVPVRSCGQENAVSRRQGGITARSREKVAPGVGETRRTRGRRAVVGIRAGGRDVLSRFGAVVSTRCQCHRDDAANTNDGPKSGRADFVGLHVCRHSEREGTGSAFQRRPRGAPSTAHKLPARSGGASCAEMEVANRSAATANSGTKMEQPHGSFISFDKGAASPRGLLRVGCWSFILYADDTSCCGVGERLWCLSTGVPILMTLVRHSSTALRTLQPQIGGGARNLDIHPHVITIGC